MTGMLQVLEPGPLALIEDAGRIGVGELGIGWSGAADPAALGLVNRLLGNATDAAAIEFTVGGARLRAQGALVVALAGAEAPLQVDGRAETINSVLRLDHGSELTIGTPTLGLRVYLGVRGGIDVPAVLGSRSRDVLAELGPAPLRPGDRLAAGPSAGPMPPVDLAPTARPRAGPVILTLLPGPRYDWLTDESRDTLTEAEFAVTDRSNRIGLRLRGPALHRVRTDELASEGLVPGALQVPPSGQPVLFGVDHPATGGYPVVGVLVATELPLLGQLRPGQRIRFALTRDEVEL